jgi:hypothetical protein
MTTTENRAGDMSAQTTGTYDRQAAGRELAARRAGQLAADPFAAIPGAGAGAAVTHPLTAGSYSATASVLATHPELAAPVSAQILAEDEDLA